MKSVFKIFLLLVMFISIFPSIAQENAQYTKNKRNRSYLKAEVITLSGDTIKALLNNFSKKERWYGDRFGKVPFILITEGKTKYKPKDIKGYRVKMPNSKWDIYKSYSNYFMKLTYKGQKINLYDSKYVVYSNSPATGQMMGSANKEYFVETLADGSIEGINKSTFKEGKYFQDCPEIVKGIEEKKYKYKDFDMVFKKYDKCQ